jgi:hypothetical protein
LVRELKRGKNICPAAMFDKTADFEEQRLFILDINNDLPEPPITVEEIQKICDYFFLPYLCHWHRPSKTGRECFSFSFLFGEPIKNLDIRNRVMQKFLTIFPQCDYTAIDYRRVFSGIRDKAERVTMGDKGTINLDYFLSKLIVVTRRVYVGEWGGAINE